MQPINEIHNYFGAQIAYYFAYIGFYTRWLIGIAVIGSLGIFHGLNARRRDAYVVQSCNLDFTLCPTCDDCNFTTASDLCENVKFTYIFDNNFTLVYAFFVPLWAVAMLEFWKRKAKALAVNWSIPTTDTDKSWKMANS